MPRMGSLLSGFKVTRAASDYPEGLIRETRAKVDALVPMKRAELLALWTELYGKPIAFFADHNFLRMALGYRIQELAYGALDPEIDAFLMKVAKEDLAERTAVRKKLKPIKPGTRLVRSWNGGSHTVEVLEAGFEYAGNRYKTLSEIARLITGTRWSGPLFFGLKVHQKNG